MNRRMLWISLIALCAAPGCDSRRVEVLKVFHAGSLSVPFQKLEAAFEAAHPGVDVQRQAYGSATAIRQITELGKRADVLGSADYRLIDSMMIRSAKQSATWNLLFARNAMCLALAPGVKGFTKYNWAAALMKPGVRLGMSNPNQDPCGYRTLMWLCLARKSPDGKRVFDDLILKCLNVKVALKDGVTFISSPSSLKAAGRLVVRPKETDLIPLLETGVIDVLSIYRSIATQHKMKFVELPAAIALSDPGLDAEYANVAVRLNADTPKAVTVRGSSIVYGVTIPTDAPNPKLAREFVRLLLSKEGQDILNQCGQAPIIPAEFSKAGGKIDLKP